MQILLSSNQHQQQDYLAKVPAMHELAINLVRYLDPKFAQLWKQSPPSGVQNDVEQVWC